MNKKATQTAFLSVEVAVVSKIPAKAGFRRVVYYFFHVAVVSKIPAKAGFDGLKQRAQIRCSSK